MLRQCKWAQVACSQVVGRVKSCLDIESAVAKRAHGVPHCSALFVGHDHQAARGVIVATLHTVQEATAVVEMSGGAAVARRELLPLANQ